MRTTVTERSLGKFRGYASRLLHNAAADPPSIPRRKARNDISTSRSAEYFDRFLRQNSLPAIRSSVKQH